MKPIETRYAGCRFRSRLEARWAVFFDRLGIRWEYEPQGIQCTWRLNWNEEPLPYLPDFWLPDHQLWAEVKGTLTQPECERLLNAAAHLSANGGGGCHDNGGNNLVVLGPIPRPRNGGWEDLPVVLHMHKGELIVTALTDKYRCHGSVIADDSGTYAPNAIDTLLNGIRRPLPPLCLYAQALEVARSARFEHGESGGKVA